MNKLQWDFNRNPYIFIQENAFENVVCKTAAIMSQSHVSKTSAKWPLCFGLNVLHKKLQAFLSHYQ